MSDQPLQRRRWRRWLFAAVGLILAILSGGIAWLWYASQQVPEFYQAAVVIPQVQAEVQGDRLERAVLELQNNVRREEQFQLTFTAEECNGWLAVDLVEKFPKLLPRGTSEPRVAFEPGTMLIAFRQDQQAMHTIVTLALEPLLVAEKNQLAVRVRQVKAGSLSLPLGPLLEEVAQRARGAKIPLRWEQHEGSPLAIIPLQFLSEAYREKHVILDSIVITTGQMTITGHTLPLEPALPQDVPAEKSPSTAE